MQGSAWQRCRVHLMRNILSDVLRGQGEMVAVFLRAIFAHALRRAGSQAVPRGRDRSQTQLPKSRRCARGRGKSRERLHRLPPASLAQDLVHKPA
jgi:transposase-like protein